MHCLKRGAAHTRRAGKEPLLPSSPAGATVLWIPHGTPSPRGSDLLLLSLGHFLGSGTESLSVIRAVTLLRWFT